MNQRGFRPSSLMAMFLGFFLFLSLGIVLAVGSKIIEIGFGMNVELEGQFWIMANLLHE